MHQVISRFALQLHLWGFNYLFSAELQRIGLVLYYYFMGIGLLEWNRIVNEMVC
jgi:hypothetical protein